jgi:hypothetical protein
MAGEELVSGDVISSLSDAVVQMENNSGGERSGLMRLSVIIFQ